MQQLIRLVLASLTLLATTTPSLAQVTDFASANKVFTRYCAGCHNEDDINGEFRIDGFDHLMAGGEQGKVITPGSSASSRLVSLMRGTLEPKMPPAGEPQPTADEIQVVAEWIDAGAANSQGEAPAIKSIETNKIAPKNKLRPVNSIAVSKQGIVAIGRYRTVEIAEFNQISEPFVVIDDLPGKVNSLEFRPDGALLIGTGIDGALGETHLDPGKGPRIKFAGHRDSVYRSTFSPDGSRFASASYDRTIRVQSTDPKVKRQLVLRGHNDAVFDVKFTPDGQHLISASADGTLKIWDAENGQRLDTRGEPLKGQTSVAVDPEGRFFFAAGEDNRIRKWDLSTLAKGKTAKLVKVKFAHQQAIVKICMKPDGKLLASLDQSGKVKFWNTSTLDEITRKDVKAESESEARKRTQAMAVAEDLVLVGTVDGFERLYWPLEFEKASELASQPVKNAEPTTNELDRNRDMAPIREFEPNDDTTTAKVTSEGSGFSALGTIERGDQDLFGFQAKAGQRLVIEARATMSGKKKSPIDTRIEILDSNGKPVPRVLLQAVRDSYFTFRGKNSTQTGDFRIHNWEEMRLGDLLYCNGEVVRLFHYPRGPDSGFNVFPNFGNRYGYFDTTAITHALHEPCYVVEPHPPGTQLPKNGLPQFLVHYVNDDDAERELGKDSRLNFVAPKDGMYFVKVTDSRNFGGGDYEYKVDVRSPVPTFNFKRILGTNPTLLPGSYRKIGVEIDRVDQFDGKVDVEFEHLPKGVTFVGPVSIEPDSVRAFFVLHADEKLEPTPVPTEKKDRTKNNATNQKKPPSTNVQPDKEVPVPKPPQEPPPTIVLKATINGKEVVHRKKLGEIKVGQPPKLRVAFEPINPTTSSGPDLPGTQHPIPTLVIKRGQTKLAKIVVQRRGYKQRINFGKEGAAVNAPFGVFVTDTGLNGVLIPPQENQRSILIQAEPNSRKGNHLIFVEAGESGKPASNPIWLKIE